MGITYSLVHMIYLVFSGVIVDSYPKKSWRFGEIIKIDDGNEKNFR